MGSKSRTTNRTSCRISAHAPLQVRPLGIGQQPVDLEMHHRFAMARVAPRQDPFDLAVLVPHRADHRMQEPGHRETAREELLVDGIDQERRVVGARFDHAAEAGVSVLFLRWVEHPDGPRLDAALVGEPEGGRDDAEEPDRARPRRSPRRSAGAGSSWRTRGGPRGAPRGHVLIDALGHGLDDRRGVELGLRVHDGSSWQVRRPVAKARSGAGGDDPTPHASA